MIALFLLLFCQSVNVANDVPVLGSSLYYRASNITLAARSTNGYTNFNQMRSFYFRHDSAGTVYFCFNRVTNDWFGMEAGQVFYQGDMIFNSFYLINLNGTTKPVSFFITGK